MRYTQQITELQLPFLHVYIEISTIPGTNCNVVYLKKKDFNQFLFEINQVTVGAWNGGNLYINMQEGQL